MSRIKETAQVKFSRFVETRSPDECWPWRGHIGTSGYGRVMFDGKVRQAHRVAWQAHNGTEPPPHLVIMHACDNRQCCNPSHLQLGTQLENMNDCTRKGRRKHPPVGRGEQHHGAKLKATDVVRMRELNLPTAELARMFGVTQRHVNAIRRGALWQRLGDAQS